MRSSRLQGSGPAVDEGTATTPVPVPAVAALLFASGFCALVYEVAWLRMLRLVFGASTAASAAVLAVFLGGLGAGGLVLGRRADATDAPLRLYARLEAAVALAAATTPLLVLLVRAVYLAVGGSATLGQAGATVLRLGLAVVVLGLPTFLMGGTLPAAVRAVESAGDAGRRATGLLYGANTVGAVGGALYATFFALEALGTNATVWSAGLANALVALAALALARGRVTPAATSPPPAAADASAGAPAPLVLAAATLAGFAFVLMELVWYRMLAPLLGGSAYTFGVVLAVALLGVGAGGLLYASGTRARRPTLAGFAAVCATEALCLVVPYACGDRVALMAMVLRRIGLLGFGPLVGVWLVVTVFVVLPAAAVAGYQFPLLVGLLGTGARAVGEDVGRAYAWNTAGAIAGSLAGGFGLIPLLTAPGTWLAVVGLLLGLAAVSLVVALRSGAPAARAVAPALIGVASILLCCAQGPTAFWRHSAIGAGRLEAELGSPEELQNLLADRRRRIAWEADGVESAVALDRWDGDAFLVNGKNDGNAIGDAGTQVMAGLVGAIFHREPHTALVVGLGTGSTAGWLAQVPSIERVDVVELEPAVVRVAEGCRAVNEDVLRNPKVHLFLGDGRERLLTTRQTYDLIVSEPSSPYRAGIASLFTREFYAAAADRLAPGGLFSQWVQAYEVDAETVRTIYATLGSVFPAVESWELRRGDMLLVAGRAAPEHDLARVTARVAAEPYRSALAFTWGVQDAEGLYAGFVADRTLAAAIAAADAARLNTDDKTLIEFAFARTVGRTGLFNPDDLRTLAVARGAARAPTVGGAPDWTLATELRAVRIVTDGGAPRFQAPEAARQHRLAARQAYGGGDLAAAREQWLAQDAPPRMPTDVSMVAEALAAAGDPRAQPYIEAVGALRPPQAEAIRARLEASTGHADVAAAHLRAAFEGYRTFPWCHRPLFARSLELAWQLAQARPELGDGLFAALAEPFAVHALDGQRVSTYFSLGLAGDFANHCLAAFTALEPWVPADRRILESRVRCYTLKQHPLLAKARADLARVVASSPTSIDVGLSGGER